MALHQRFATAFGRLLRSWRRYQRAPRQPERVTELAEARADLDEARTETWEAHKAHPPTWRREDAPEPPPSKGSLSREQLAKLHLRGGGFGKRP